MQSHSSSSYLAWPTDRHGPHCRGALIYSYICVYNIAAQQGYFYNVFSYIIQTDEGTSIFTSVILLLCIFWTIQHLDICMVCRASCLLRMNIQRKPGDWNCKNCQHLNFSRRDYCQRCREPRADLQFSDGYSTGGVLTSLDIRRATGTAAAATITLPAAAAASSAALSSGTSQRGKVQLVLRVTLLVAVTAPQFVLGGKLATGYAQGDLQLFWFQV